MPIKKLIVEEYEITEENPPELQPIGFKYSWFMDPETGKFYRPKTTFQVTGDNLEDLFEEVPTDSE